MLTSKRIFAVVLCLLVVLCVAISADAQTYTLSGKVTDTAGHAVPSAKVSAKSLATGHVFEAATNTDGMYSIADLAGGDYEVWAAAGELKAQPIKVTLAAAQTTDIVLAPAPGGSSSIPNAPQKQSPSTTPSLSDLGFSQQEMQADTQLQATLAKRTRMLKTHQRLGLITAIPWLRQCSRGRSQRQRAEMARW